MQHNGGGWPSLGIRRSPLPGQVRCLIDHNVLLRAVLRIMHGLQVEIDLQGAASLNWACFSLFAHGLDTGLDDFAEQSAFGGMLRQL